MNKPEFLGPEPSVEAALPVAFFSQFLREQSGKVGYPPVWTPNVTSFLTRLAVPGFYQSRAGRAVRVRERDQDRLDISEHLATLCISP